MCPKVPDERLRSAVTAAQEHREEGLARAHRWIAAMLADDKVDAGVIERARGQVRQGTFSEHPVRSLGAAVPLRGHLIEI